MLNIQREKINTKVDTESVSAMFSDEFLDLNGGRIQNVIIKNDGAPITINEINIIPNYYIIYYIDYSKVRYIGDDGEVYVPQSDGERHGASKVIVPIENSNGLDVSDVRIPTTDIFNINYIGTGTGSIVSYDYI